MQEFIQLLELDFLIMKYSSLKTLEGQLTETLLWTPCF